MTREHFERIVERLIDSEVEQSWAGGGDPEEMPLIEALLRRRRRAYEKALDELFAPVYSPEDAPVYSPEDDIPF